MKLRVTHVVKNVPRHVVEFTVRLYRALKMAYDSLTLDVLSVVSYFDETPRFGSQLYFRLQAVKVRNLMNLLDRAILSHWVQSVNKIVMIRTWGQILSEGVDRDVAVKTSSLNLKTQNAKPGQTHKLKPIKKPCAHTEQQTDTTQHNRTQQNTTQKQNTHI
jgi:hypothetical protein